MSLNLLNDSDKKISQPSTIKIDLMNHQKTMVYKMLEIESTGIIEIENYQMREYTNMMKIKSKKGIINTNIGILGDKVGSGKTLMIITLISIKKKINERLIEMGGNLFYSLKLEPSSLTINTNLIIVPQKLLPQWRDAFNKYSTNLKINTISSNKDINKFVIKKEIKKNNINDKKKKCYLYEDSDNESVYYGSYDDLDSDSDIDDLEIIIKDKIEEFDVTIIGDTMYKRFYKTCRKYRFNRILIDEADTIKLSKDIECQFNFMWFITGTSSGLFSGSKIFLNKIFKNNDLNILKYFVFKNDNSYIDQSIKLPPPKIFKIKCLSPKELNIIKNLIPQSVLQMINAGNTEQAIKALNCNVDTNENIFQVITKNLVDSISNKEIELEAETKKHYPINLKKEHDQKIKFIENQLEKLKDKYKDIKKRIYELNDTNCPVCMSEFSNPVMVSCCNNTFCFDCLALSIGELKNNKCPYCRQQICKKQIHIFESDTIKKSEDSLNLSKNNHDIKDKLDVLLDIVQKKTRC